MIDIRTAPGRSALAVLLGIAMLLASVTARAQSAGVVTRLLGAATIDRAGATLSPTPGAELRSGDVLRSGPGARIEMRFHDGTTITLGAATEMRIDAFVFDPGTPEGNLALSLAGGVFRAVSGAIAERRGAPLTIATPVATIGIRGTTFWGEQRPDQLEVALLAGKGVFLRNAFGASEITRLGEGVTARLGAAPQAAIPWSAEKLRAALATVAWP